MDEFLKRCFHHSGQYNAEEDFVELDKKLKEKEVFRPLVISFVCCQTVFNYKLLSLEKFIFRKLCKLVGNEIKEPVCVYKPHATPPPPPQKKKKKRLLNIK